MAESKKDPTTPATGVTGINTVESKTNDTAPAATPTETVESTLVQNQEDQEDFAALESIINEIVDKKLEGVMSEIASLKKLIEDVAASPQSTARPSVSVKNPKAAVQDILQKHGLLYSSVSSPEKIKQLELSDEEKAILIDFCPTSLEDFNITISVADLPDYIEKLVNGYGLMVSKLSDQNYLKEKEIPKDDVKKINRFVTMYTEVVLSQSWVKLSPQQSKEIKEKFSQE